MSGGFGARIGLMLALWAAAVIAGVLMAPSFLQWSTITFIGQYLPILGVLAIAQALVMLAGGPGIDLSLGGTLSLTALAIAALFGAGVPLVLAVAIGLALGGLLGALNGWLIAHLGVPSLIGTLATMFLYGGLAVALTGGSPIGGLPRELAWLAQGQTFGVPNHVWLVLIPVAVAAHVLLTRTRAGAHIHASGCDEQAAYLAGVAVSRLRFRLYCLAGVLAAVGAVMTLAWFQTARPDAGQGMELLSVTIAVLGGVHIFGGEGRISGVIVALVTVTTLQAAMQLANIPQAWQLGAVGALLILSVVLDRGWSGASQWLTRLQGRSRQANQSA